MVELAHSGHRRLAHDHPLDRVRGRPRAHLDLGMEQVPVAQRPRERYEDGIIAPADGPKRGVRQDERHVEAVSDPPPRPLRPQLARRDGERRDHVRDTAVTAEGVQVVEEGEIAGGTGGYGTYGLRSAPLGGENGEGAHREGDGSGAGPESGAHASRPSRSLHA